MEICIKKLMALAAEQRAEIEALTTFVIAMYGRLELKTSEIDADAIEKFRCIIDESKKNFLEARLIEIEDVFPSTAAELSQMIDEAAAYREEMRQRKLKDLEG